MTYTTRAFWAATTERAIKTFAQAAIAVLGANTFGLLDADWVGVLSSSGMAAVVSVLTSIASSGMNGDSPSLAGEELKTGRHSA